MNETVTFNDVVLSDLYTIINVHRPMAGMTNETQEISGFDGTRIVGSHIPSANITMRVIIKDMPELDRREALHQLSAIIHTDEPKRLEFGSDNGRYYMAKFDGQPEPQEYMSATVVELTFMLEQAVLYGKTKTATVPSGGSVTFTVGGTYVTRPTIEGASIEGSNGLWGLRLDDGDVMRMEATTTARPVSIDCESRVAFYNSTLVAPTPESDWFEMSPGQHTIQNDVGTGACTVTWQEMWI